MSIQSIATTGSLAVATATTATAGSQSSARAVAKEDASGSPGKVAAVSTPTSSVEQKQRIEAAVNAVKEFVQPMASNLEFKTDEDTGRTVIKITDASSGELIRQIPSEEMLEIAQALDRLQGLLVRQKA